MARPNPVARSGIRSDGISMFGACIYGGAAGWAVLFLGWFAGSALIDAGNRTVLRVNAANQEANAPAAFRSVVTELRGRK